MTKYLMKTKFHSDKPKKWPKKAKFRKMAKCVFSWPAQLKMAKFVEIGHGMANLATLFLTTVSLV